jgi:hypothetical protein
MDELSHHMVPWRRTWPALAFLNESIGQEVRVKSLEVRWRSVISTPASLKSEATMPPPPSLTHCPDQRTLPAVPMKFNSDIESNLVAFSEYFPPASDRPVSFFAWEILHCPAHSFLFSL